MADLEATTRTLERMRRNDTNPTMRANALEYAREQLRGYYHDTAEHLLEEGIRGQAIMATINQVRHAAQDTMDQEGVSFNTARDQALREYDKARFIELAREKNEEFDQRRVQLEGRLIQANQEDTEE